MTLGDGESAAIAVAHDQQLAVALDDQKARRIAGERFPQLRLVSSVKVFALAEVAAELGNDLPNAVYSALINARMEFLPKTRPGCECSSVFAPTKRPACEGEDDDGSRTGRRLARTRPRSRWRDADALLVPDRSRDEDDVRRRGAVNGVSLDGTTDDIPPLDELRVTICRDVGRPRSAS
jgi:hypothetical protein